MDKKKSSNEPFKISSKFVAICFFTFIFICCCIGLYIVNKGTISSKVAGAFAGIFIGIIIWIIISCATSKNVYITD